MTKHPIYILLLSLIVSHGFGQTDNWNTLVVDKYLTLRMPSKYERIDTLSTVSFRAENDSDVYIVERSGEGHVIKDTMVLKIILQGALVRYLRTEWYSKFSVVDSSIGGTFGKFLILYDASFIQNKSKYFYFTVANGHFYRIGVLKNAIHSNEFNNIIKYYNSVHFDSANIRENAIEFRTFEERKP